MVIRGGFAGGEEIHADREVFTNVTVLSGAIAETGFSYHIVTITGLTSSTRVDGFTIEDAVNDLNTGGANDGEGAAITIRSSSSVVANCVADDNGANVTNTKGVGAGLFVTGIFGAAGPTVTNCAFTDNSAIDGGGAVYVSATTVTMTNCVIARNFAQGELFNGEVVNGQGGGIHERNAVRVQPDDHGQHRDARMRRRH
jgi:predicted outer membrane repeat protein